MKRILAAMALAGLVGSVCVTARDASQYLRTVDPTKTISSYMLSPGEDSCFRIGDGVASKFWDAWDLNTDLNKATLDASSLSRGPRLTSAADAGLTIQSVYSTDGVYFLFTVADDDWVTNVGGLDYENDAVELYLSDMSATQMYANINAAFLLPNYQQMGEGTSQMQIRFGGAEPTSVTAFNFNKYDDLLMQFALNNKVTFTDALTNYKIQVELIKKPDPGTRQQEWFIPWTCFGGDVGSRSSYRVAQGGNSTTTLGLCFGYNDVDGADSTSALRWRNQADPFTVDAEGAPSDIATTVDTWGDISFLEKGSSLDAVCAAKGINISLLSDCVNSVKFFPGRSVFMGSKVVGTSYYTLSGQKLAVVNNQVMAAKNTIILERAVLANGSIASRKITAR